MHLCNDCGEMYEHGEKQRACPKCGSGGTPQLNKNIPVDEDDPYEEVLNISKAAQPTQVKSDVEDFDLTQIPFEAERRLGCIFREGEKKYGKGNWRIGKGNLDYQLERANHTLKHLKIYIHWLEFGEYLGTRKPCPCASTAVDAGSCNCQGTLRIAEDDLAKVAWFCMTQMELERMEK